MLSSIAEELTGLVDTAAARFEAVAASQAAAATRDGKWSAQEILGHLIDSASNNHQRFVRAPQAAELQSAPDKPL